VTIAQLIARGHVRSLFQPVVDVDTGAELAGSAGFVCALGTGLAEEPYPGIRGASRNLERRFDDAITFRRESVERAASALLSRVAALAVDARGELRRAA
jgi:hypothetical protein